MQNLSTKRSHPPNPWLCKDYVSHLKTLKRERGQRLAMFVSQNLRRAALGELRSECPWQSTPRSSNFHAKSTGTWASNLALGTFFNYPRLKQPRSRVCQKKRLRREYAWLEHCKLLVEDKLVVLPKPHGPLITHGQLTILVMDFIGGATVDDMLIDGPKLSDEDASRTCDAYLALSLRIMVSQRAHL